MRKNKSMRTASALLVAVLLTTCIISGVFAKYTTKAESQDTARVAKWGVVASVSDSIFGKKYAIGTAGEDANKITTSDDADGFSVATSDTSSLVAPGTKNEDFSYEVIGTPEVDGKIKVVIEGENVYLGAGTYYRMVEVKNPGTDFTNYYIAVKDSNNKLVGYQSYAQAYNYNQAEGFGLVGKYYTREENPIATLSEAYYPVVFSDGTTPANVSSDSLEAVATTLASEIPFKAGQTLGGPSGISLPQITWEWKFCNSDTDCGGHDIDGNGDFVAACNYCNADTILGDAAAGAENVNKIINTDKMKNNKGDYYLIVNEEMYNTDLTFNFKMVVTQED